MNANVTDSTAIRFLTPFGFQELNREIYSFQNDLHFGQQDIGSRILSHVTRVLKAVRKGKLTTISWDLPMAFSWALALANALHIDLGSEMWKRFPNVCPYCGYAPCDCKIRNLKRRKIKVNPALRPHTLQEFQLMFARIYPNSLSDAAIHLAEETGEVHEALLHFRGLHQNTLYEEVVLELTDLITTIFSVATATKFDLATEMERLFAKGCPGCGTNPCSCGFFILKDGVARHNSKKGFTTRRHRRLAIC